RRLRNRNPLAERSDDPVQRPTGRCKCVYTSCYFGILNQRRRVMRLEPGIKNERSAAAPVFVLDERSEAVKIRRGVGSRERRPQKVTQRLGDKLAVVDDDDEAERDFGFRISDCGLNITTWSFNCEHAR